VISGASVAVDAVSDPGARGQVARTAIADIAPPEKLTAPGHFAIEVLSALVAIAGRPAVGFVEDDIPLALDTLSRLGIEIEATPWPDVRRAWELSRGSVRYSDALYLAAAERTNALLLTSDGRLARSGADVACQIRTL